MEKEAILSLPLFKERNAFCCRGKMPCQTPFINLAIEYDVDERQIFEGD